MNLSCNLYVDGELEGKIHSTKEVNIGKNGHINGDVTTQRLVVQGFVEGNLHADRVEIKANGHVKGTVESAELVIEAKGIFEGNSIVKGANQPAAKKISNNLHSKEEIDQEIKKA